MKTSRKIPLRNAAAIQLRAAEPAVAGVLRVGDTLLQEAIRRIEHPSRNREEDLHAVRTAIKHVRAILRLLRPMIGDRIFQMENLRLKKVAQRLAPMRDAAVGQQVLGKLASASRHQKRRNAASIVQVQLAREVGPPVIREEVMRATARALEVNRRRLAKLRVGDVDRRIIESGLEKVYRACRHRMKRAFATDRADSFHRWRIRLKNLYHELQFFLPIWPKHLGPMVARLKKLQEQVGQDHDLNVLMAALHRMPERFSSEAAVGLVQRHLQKRSQKLRRTCRPLAEKIFRERPGRFLRRFDRHWDEVRKA